MKKLTRRGMLFGLSLPFFSSVTKVAKAEEKATWEPIRLFWVEKRSSGALYYEAWLCIFRMDTRRDHRFVVDNFDGKVEEVNDRTFVLPKGNYFTCNEPEKDHTKIINILNKQRKPIDDFEFRYDSACNGVCAMRLMKRA